MAKLSLQCQSLHELNVWYFINITQYFSKETNKRMYNYNNYNNKK